MRPDTTPNPEYELITRVGRINLEYGVKGQELKRELLEAGEKFVRAMELQGLTLYRHPRLVNPRIVTNPDGSPQAVYAIDWEGKRKPRLGPDGKPLPRKKETSLEETEGEVEYRFVGVFWSPRVSMEILKHKLQIRDEERAARNPLQFGHGGTVKKIVNPAEYPDVETEEYERERRNS